MNESPIPQPLDYQPPTRRVRASLPARLLILSLVPTALCFTACFGNHNWRIYDWIQDFTRLDRERVTGILIMASGFTSFLSVIILPFYRKRWPVVLVLILHMINLGLTIYPGYILIEFFMHWGPGGPGM